MKKLALLLTDERLTDWCPPKPIIVQMPGVLKKTFYTTSLR